MTIVGVASVRTAQDPEPGDWIILLARMNYSMMFSDISEDALQVFPLITVRPNGPPEQDGRIRIWESDRSWSIEEWRDAMCAWGGVLVAEKVDAGEDN